MKRSGPDSLTSWVIAGACCFINMMMFGMARLSGVLFVASVPRFQVPREKASFPYTFANFVRNFSGPLVGYLGHRFGVRSVTTIGCFLGAAGIGACFVAEQINVITILWGVIFGLGFGLGNVLLPVSINEYFDKKRATASGISFSGACLGSFILPPVVELLLNEYGLSGTFIFLSGFVLNCVPAAMLLKKPKFEINPYKDAETGERQSIVSGKNVKLYTVESDPKKLWKGAKNSDLFLHSSMEGIENTGLTYEERLRGLSTQTLVSEYCVHMSTSEPLDADEIIRNSKGRRQVDHSDLETESVISVDSASNSQDLINSERDDVFEKDVRSSSVQYEKSVPTEIGRNRAATADSTSSVKNSFRTTNAQVGYQNYGYQTDVNDLINKEVVPRNDIARRTSSQTVYNEYAYFNSYQTDLKFIPDGIKPSNVPSLSKSLDSSEVEDFKVRHGKLDDLEKKEFSTLGAFSIVFDPMFILIATTSAIYCFTFVCLFTVIVDFARDLNIGETNEKYVLMAVSVGDLVGRLGLGWVTDGGYMTSVGFTALLFACQGVAIAAIPFSDGFISLITVGSLYGLTEAGLIVLFPIIIAQYIDHDKQTVAIPSSAFLSGPACLAIPPLIGYFRDHLGAYDYLFYLVALMSFACCFVWMLAPCITRCQKKK